MSRNAEIERILEAWWQSEHCPDNERSNALAALNALLDQIVARSDKNFTRDQIQDYLFSQYQDFRIQRKRNDKLAVAQSAAKKPSV